MKTWCILLAVGFAVLVFAADRVSAHGHVVWLSSVEDAVTEMETKELLRRVMRDEMLNGKTNIQLTVFAYCIDHHVSKYRILTMDALHDVLFRCWPYVGKRAT